MSVLLDMAEGPLKDFYEELGMLPGGFEYYGGQDYIEALEDVVKEPEDEALLSSMEGLFYELDMNDYMDMEHMRSSNY